MEHKVDWVSVQKARFCPHLLSKLINVYRVPKWLPAFLHKPIRSVKSRLTKVSVIVEVNPEHSFSTLNRANLGGLLGCQIDYRLDIVNSFSTKVNIRTLKKLVAHEAVSYVWHDREVKALTDVATPVVGAPQVWNSKVKGKGIGIAILDTGIYPHPDFIKPNNRIIAFKDFIQIRSMPYDDNGHGTHCAGDAAGNGFCSSGKYCGPAPMANLIGVKVLDKKGSGRLSKVLAGIQWCIKHKNKYRIKVLSMSMGSPAIVSYKIDPLCRAVEKARNAGIVVCCAAGNEGPKAKTINVPGIDPAVITIGALDDKNTLTINDDIIAPFSSRGPTIDGLTKPDLVSHGVNIISTRAPGAYIDKINRQTRVGQWYTSLSGTSMATPICSGVVALIMEARPELLPDNIKNILMSTCRTVSSDPNAQGAGLIDAEAAIRLTTAYND